MFLGVLVAPLIWSMDLIKLKVRKGKNWNRKVLIRNRWLLNSECDFFTNYLIAQFFLLFFFSLLLILKSIRRYWVLLIILSTNPPQIFWMILAGRCISNTCEIVLHFQRQPKGVLVKKFSGNMQQIYRRTRMGKCDFNKVALQLCWNHTSRHCSPVNFAAYFQNTFLWEHPCGNVSAFLKFHGFTFL